MKCNLVLRCEQPLVLKPFVLLLSLRPPLLLRLCKRRYMLVTLREFIKKYTPCIIRPKH
jgi:hypothetical protein